MKHGIVVTNVPDYCIDEVADQAISFSFMLIRRIPIYVSATRNGKWHWSVGGCDSIKRFREITFRLIGFGRIAQNIVRKIQVFGIKVISYDPYVSEGFMNSYGVKKVELNALLKESDVVSVMCVTTSETYHIIDGGCT